MAPQTVAASLSNQFYYYSICSSKVTIRPGLAGTILEINLVSWTFLKAINFPNLELLSRIVPNFREI